MSLEPHFVFLPYSFRFTYVRAAQGINIEKIIDSPFMI